MNDDLRTGSKGIELIKAFEGVKLRSYLCPARIWTIGVGHTGPEVRTGMMITEQQAMNLLSSDMLKFEREIKRVVSAPLTQWQFDALVSFVYNVGGGNFRSSTLLKKLNQHLYEEVPAQMLRWNKANGVALAGLTRRRTSEGRLFETGKFVY